MTQSPPEPPDSNSPDATPPTPDGTASGGGSPSLDPWSEGTTAPDTDPRRLEGSTEVDPSSNAEAEATKLGSSDAGTVETEAADTTSAADAADEWADFEALDDPMGGAGTQPAEDLEANQVNRLANKAQAKRRPRNREGRSPSPGDRPSRFPKQPEGRQKSTLTRFVAIGLRSLIRLLEWMVALLEADPQPGEAANPILRGAQQARNNLQPALKAVWGGWKARAIPAIRAVLPLAVNERWSDPALTGILAGTLALLFVVLPTLAPSGPPPDIQISEVPQTLEAPDTPDVTVTPAPTPLPDTEIPIAEDAEPESPPAPSASPTPIPTFEPVPTPAPAPSPDPVLALTPEQTLIASIQDRVSEVSDRYTDGLILSVRANFRQSTLITRLGTAWYDLPAEQQDNLANDLLKQSTRLDFSKLELIDPVGNRLARSPVVGDRMIVLRRKPPDGLGVG